MSIAANLALLDTYDTTIAELELFLEHNVRQCQAAAFYLLRSVPGIDKIPALTLNFEIHDMERFPAVGNFLSYSSMVAGRHESDGKKQRFSARATYHMLRRRQPFDAQRFLTA